MQIIQLAAGAENICENREGERIAVRVHRPELHVYPVENPVARVLICPGGGYTRLMLGKEALKSRPGWAGWAMRPAFLSIACQASLAIRMISR